VTRIYTKKGDDGSTSLWYGGRVAKSDARTEAYGAVDEAASALGMARSLCEALERDVEVDILRIQNELFVLGAELATAPEAAHRLEDGVSRVTAEMVDALDGVIDRYMDEVDLPPKFVIPGGRPVSAALDVARATIRRAERRVVALAAAEDISGEVVRYLNRASDAAYAMARFTDTDTPELFAGRDASPDEG
jgi:cob(I)alamin adenosyltransferase